MRNLLICAQNFPPLGGGGVIRMVKFVKYLPAFGWNPIVLTIGEDQHVGNPIDPSMMAQLDPNLTIIRARTLGVRGRAPVATQENRGQLPTEETLHANSSSVRRVLKAMTRRFRVWEDHGYLWLPNATRAAFKAATDYNIDAVLTTSPPHATQWIGYWLKRRRHLPWVADFRDGWTDDPLFQSESDLRNKMERMQERAIVSNADHVFCAADTIRDDLRRKYSHISAERIETLRNGFDPEDFAFHATEAETSASREDVDCVQQNRPMRVTYLGSVGGTARPIGALLQALQTLAAEGLGEEAIEAHFVGTMPEADRIAATVLRNVHAIGFMPHTEAVRLMQEADVLLAIMGSEWTKAVAGKLYEYAAAQKPILLLSGNGASRDLVIENQWGWVCDPLDVDAITRTLRECLRLYKAAELPGFAPTAASIVKYDRRQATQRLAAVLDLLIA